MNVGRYLDICTKMFELGIRVFVTWVWQITALLDGTSPSFSAGIREHWVTAAERQEEQTLLDSLLMLLVQAETSLECYLRMCLEMREHNWMKQVSRAHARDESGQKTAAYKRKEVLEDLL